MLAFLCGEAEDCSNGGQAPHRPGARQAWRSRLRRWLEENLNHRVYDPLEEARRGLTEEEFQSLAQWKATDLERYRKALRILINQALDVMQNKADYVVCYWDEATGLGAGAQAEITAAYRKGIPVYLVTGIPVEQVSGWVLGCADRIFSSLDELKTSLAATYGKEARQHRFWGPG